MKRIILTFLSLTTLLCFQSMGQCTPDPNATDPGLYPLDSLATVYRNAPYSDIVTLVLPGSFSVATINWIEVTSITGFPNGISYDCNPSSCVFPGGGSYCIDINGTTSDPIGLYPLDIQGQGEVVISGFTQTLSLAQLVQLSGGALTMPSYQLRVVDTTGSSSQFAVTANASTTSSCPGDNVTLSVDVFNGQATAYAWSPATSLDNAAIASPTASPSETTTYSVTVTDTSGATASNTVTITVDTLTPSAAFTYTDNNGVVSFDASGSTGNNLIYEWDFDDGSTPGSGATTTYTYSSSNTYDVTLTVTNGCNVSDDATESVNVVVSSIKDLAQAVDYIKVFPNPSNGNFEVRIKSADIKSNYVLRLMDLQGKEIYVENVSNQDVVFKKSMNFNHLNTGMYFLHISSDEMTYVERIVVQK